MNIVMMTNTFTPHVSGVARSVADFTEAYRRRGHRVLVVAPEFPDRPADEPDVVRIPALQNFNGSDFSVVLPVPGPLNDALQAFQPDIIHAHQPFLIGSTALRVALERDAPLVFTHHTMYEAYTHYVPGDSAALQRFVVALSTSYANSCDRVFAPSESIARVLRDRGVDAPLQVVPTGIDRQAFVAGDGRRGRQAHGIPADARVVGHVGRLAEEKNPLAVARAMLRVAEADPRVHALVVGDGPAAAELDAVFAGAGMSHRLHRPGALRLPALADAYAAMDVFAFASFTETQGMVLAEAMAAGVPVVALDAPGAREVVNDRNGRLLPAEADSADMAAAIQSLLALPADRRVALDQAVAETARAVSLDECADRAIRAYQDCLQQRRQSGVPRHVDRASARGDWHRSVRRVQAEWAVIRGMARAAGRALTGGEDARAGH